MESASAQQGEKARTSHLIMKSAQPPEGPQFKYIIHFQMQNLIDTMWLACDQVASIPFRNALNNCFEGAQERLKFFFTTVMHIFCSAVLKAQPINGQNKSKKESPKVFDRTSLHSDCYPLTQVYCCPVWESRVRIMLLTGPNHPPTQRCLQQSKRQPRQTWAKRVSWRQLLDGGWRLWRRGSRRPARLPFFY